MPCLDHRRVWLLVRENVGRVACGMKEYVILCRSQYVKTRSWPSSTPDSLFTATNDMKRASLVNHTRPRKALAVGVDESFAIA